jgi:murein L,D-transpeptidase YcbB/YkuD
MSVKWNIIAPVKKPADLEGIAPGKLPEKLLKPIKGGGKLHWRAADAWEAMVEAAKADGVELKPVSAGDTYRSFESQLMAFRQRYQKEPIEGAQTRTFEGVKWYKKDPKLASLAAPGTSQHNSGLAVDVHTAAEPKRLDWLIDNVRKFGFSWEVVPEEPWHLRYTEGDNPPAAVVEFITKRDGQAPAQPASVAKASVDEGKIKEEAKTLPVLTKGNKGQAIRRAQRLLDKHGFNCKDDGDFGAKTEGLVKSFQLSRGIESNGIINQATWEALLG